MANDGLEKKRASLKLHELKFLISVFKENFFEEVQRNF